MSRSDNEVLVRVEGVSKKFCRSLKKSLWYGVCDIGAELNPFRRRVAEVAGSELLVASGNTSAEGASAPVTSYPPLVTSPTGEASLREGEFFAVKDVSFELRRGELRTLGQSEKEVSKKCLGATKVPDSGRRRHQCLGLIGHNGALPALLAVAG
jgi:lipopolysaccharide transport system ATP-binding protein